MKAILLSILFVFPVLNINAENIKGKIIDENGTPVEFANIVLLSLPDSTFIQGTVSDQNGVFMLEINEQKGVLRISSIGYVTAYRLCNAGEIGLIQLNSDTQILDEVVVKGELPKTQLKGDALVTNVQNTVLTKAGTAVDVLGKIPGMVKEGTALKVLGRGAPEVYINGRKVRDETELEQLASDNIKSVEVVTNPGARYDATVKAVVRIYTKKVVGEGLGINNRIYTSYNKKMTWLDQLNLNYRTGGMDVFAMLFYADSYSWRKHHTNQDTYLDKHWLQNSFTDLKSRSHNVTGNLGVNYMINTDHSFGASYRMRKTPYYDIRSTILTDIFQDNEQYETSANNSIGKVENTTHQLNIYYTGKVGAWNIDFNADGIWRKQNDNDANIENVINGEGDENQRNITTATDTQYKLYAGKLTFGRPLWGGELLLGGEYSYMNRTTDYSNVEGFINNTNNEIKEKGIALFAEYSRHFGIVNVLAGIRSENINFDYYDRGRYVDEQSKNYNNVFPSLSVTVPVGKTQLMLGYKADIQRPYYAQLSSSVIYVNRYTYESGNPLLKPNINHTLSLKASYKWILLQLGYQRVMDAMFNISSPYSEEDPTIALLNKENVDAFDKMFASVSLSPVLGFWSPVFTASMDKQWLETETPYGIVHLNKPQFSINWNNSLKFPGGFIFSAGIMWNSACDMENGKLLNNLWMINASLYKGIMKDRLTILLQAEDIFNTSKQNMKLYFGSLRTLEQFNKANSRSVSLTLRYKFNSSKSKYRGTGAGNLQKERM